MKLAGWLGYRFAQAIIWLLCVGLWSLKVEGRNQIPKTGAFLLCPVHRSNIDGPITGILAWRRMKYLVKESVFKVPVAGDTLKAMGAIPVNRGTADRTSMHKSLESLEAGYGLVLFPEGTRRAGPVIEEIQEGAAYLALRAGVPIIPVGIGGSEGANPKGSKRLRRVPVRVLIGEPIVFDQPEAERVPRSTVRKGTELLKMRMQELFDEVK